MFSELLHPLSNYGHDIASLNVIKSDILQVDYKCKASLNEQNETLPELLDWNFLNFTTEYIIIKLNFSNPIYISTYEEKDKLDVTYLHPDIFLA